MGVRQKPLNVVIMTKEELGQAMELLNAGISMAEVCVYFDCDSLALDLVIKEVTRFLNVHDRIHNVLLVKVSEEG